MAPNSSQLGVQLIWLFVLAIPVACGARTVVFEEIFREIREFCHERSKAGRSVLTRKCFYLFTCEYCFSHYVTIVFMILTNYSLLLDDWRGHVIAFFSIVFVANVYLSMYSRLRVDITQAKVEIRQIDSNEKQSD